MFKDFPEGQTHSYGDSCIPAHQPPKEEVCGTMILTPSPLHNGGMWCAEKLPCKLHPTPEVVGIAELDKELAEHIDFICPGGIDILATDGDSRGGKQRIKDTAHQYYLAGEAAGLQKAVEVIDEYLKGLILIPDPQATKEKLKALITNLK